MCVIFVEICEANHKCSGNYTGVDVLICNSEVCFHVVPLWTIRIHKYDQHLVYHSIGALYESHYSLLQDRTTTTPLSMKSDFNTIHIKDL